eukprot:Hpha_TRINITY_DN16497_c1_g2::TRINITY_DN16497_c1_g2_i1::g.161112::m.161112
MGAQGNPRGLRRLSARGVGAESPLTSPRRLRKQIAVQDAGGGAGGPCSPGGRNQFESPRRAQAKRTFEVPSIDVVAHEDLSARPGPGLAPAGTRLASRGSRRGHVPEPASPTKDILRYAGLGRTAFGGQLSDGTDRGHLVQKGRGGVGIVVDPKMVVVEVERGSAAHHAGLKKGMKLTEVDGRPVHSQNEAVAALKRSGREVYLKTEAKQGGKCIVQSSHARSHAIGDRLSGFFNAESVARTPPAPISGLPGVGPQHGWTEDLSDAPPPFQSPAVKKNYQVCDKPNVCSPRLGSVTSAGRPSTPHKNSTSYQIAAARGDIDHDGSWAEDKINRRKATGSHAPQGAGNVVVHHAPTDPAQRTALWLSHSPARGRARQGGMDTARGILPGLHQDQSTLIGKRQSQPGHSLLPGTGVPVVGQRPDERRRSATPDRPRSSWTAHGDITAWRNTPHNAQPERLATGHRIRTFHHSGPDLSVNRQEYRSFTPNSRHMRPMPEPTDVLSHNHRHPVESPRSGRRFPAYDSPHRTHRSEGVWGCLRTE